MSLPAVFVLPRKLGDIPGKKTAVLNVGNLHLGDQKLLVSADNPLNYQRKQKST